MGVCGEYNRQHRKACNACLTPKMDRMTDTWECDDCGEPNRIHREHCNCCGAKRAARPEASATTNSTSTDDVSWACRNCGETSRVYLTKCNKCGDGQMAQRAATHDDDDPQGLWNKRSSKGARRRQVDEEFCERSHQLCSGFPWPLLESVLCDTRTQHLFEHLRHSFQLKYGASICGRFSRRLQFLGKVELVPVPLAIDVQRAFLATWHAETYPRFKLNITPALHGTKSKSLPSIYQRGFLIPSAQNGVTVAHGSAHGLGIYLASCDSSALAARHAEDYSCVLVCGFLDNAVKKVQPQRLGSQLVTAESDAVRHVGSAVVIFDENRVVPLFRFRRR